MAFNSSADILPHIVLDTNQSNINHNIFSTFSDSPIMLLYQCIQLYSTTCLAILRYIIISKCYVAQYDKFGTTTMTPLNTVVGTSRYLG